MLIGLARATRQNPPLAIRFAIAVVCYPAVYCLTHPETYYIRPLDPLINVLAMYALVSFIEGRKKEPFTSAD